MDSQLGLEILKAVKPVGGIELFVILAVAALDFAIVPGCIWADEFVTDAKTLKFRFKERRLVASFWKQAVGKFGAVVGLDTFRCSPSAAVSPRTPRSRCLDFGVSCSGSA